MPMNPRDDEQASGVGCMHGPSTLDLARIYLHHTFELMHGPEGSRSRGEGLQATRPSLPEIVLCRQHDWRWRLDRGAVVLRDDRGARDREAFGRRLPDLRQHVLILAFDEDQ